MTYVSLLNSKDVVDRHALRIIHKFDKQCDVLIEGRVSSLCDNNLPYGKHRFKKIALSLIH